MGTPQVRNGEILRVISGVQRVSGNGRLDEKCRTVLGWVQPPKLIGDTRQLLKSDRCPISRGRSCSQSESTHL